MTATFHESMERAERRAIDAHNELLAEERRSAGRAPRAATTFVFSPSKAFSHLFSMEPFVLLPPLLFAFACVLFVASYRATFSSGVLAPLGDSLTPPISLLMFAGPGRRIGQLGFPTLCVGFYVCMRRLKRALVAAGIKSVLLFGSANTAFAALAVVGLVPLGHELAQRATRSSP